MVRVVMFVAAKVRFAAGCTSARGANGARSHSSSLDIKYNYTVSVAPLWMVAKREKTQ